MVKEGIMTWGTHYRVKVMTLPLLMTGKDLCAHSLVEAFERAFFITTYGESSDVPPKAWSWDSDIVILTPPKV